MSIKDTLTLVTFVVAMIGFAGMMRIKTDVQTMDTARSKLVSQRAELRETKRVLEAEWALLASPERLQALADKAGKVYVNGSALSHIPFAPTVSASIAAPKVAVAASPTVAQSSPTASIYGR